MHGHVYAYVMVHVCAEKTVRPYMYCVCACVYVCEGNDFGGMNMQGGEHCCSSDISHCFQKSL